MQTVHIIECLQNFVEKRKPDEERLGKKIDLDYQIEGQSVFLVEKRPAHDNSGVVREHAIAKATYVKSARQWKVFWMQANRRWYPYAPTPVVKEIDDFVMLVDNDSSGCFFG